jgi:hypothetical protein
MRDALSNFGTVSCGTASGTPVYCPNPVNTGELNSRSRFTRKHTGAGSPLKIVGQNKTAMQAGEYFIMFICDDADNEGTYTEIIRSGPTQKQPPAKTRIPLSLPEGHRPYINVGFIAYSSGSLVSVEMEAWVDAGANTEEAAIQEEEPLVSEITIQSEGSTFAPVIVLNDGYTLGVNATAIWTFPDASTDETLTPSKSYGSAASRANTLVVTPWAALRRLNVGYGADDSGDASIELVANQNVSAITGLSIARSGLRELCISYNPITTISISALTLLTTFEAFGAGLTSIVPPPSIKRLCLEECAIGTLNVSGCPDLEDLRAAANEMTSLIFGEGAFSHLWHICVRENLLTSLRTTGFPVLDDLWIWNNPGLTGTLVVDSSAIESIDARDCGYTAVDLSDVDTERVNIKIDVIGNDVESVILGSDSVEQIHVTDNQGLETIDLSGQSHILKFYGLRCSFDAAAVEHILHTLDASGIESDTPGVFDGVNVDLSGGLNAAVNAAAQAHADSLETKGWVVAYNTSEVPADVNEDFEDSTLAAGLALVTPASLITLPSTAWFFKGAASMRVNLNGIAAPHYLEFSPASGTFNLGFAYKSASFPSGEYYARIMGIGNPTVGENYATRITDQGNTGEIWRRLTAWIYGTTYTLCDIVNGQEVRFAVSFTTNGTHTIRCYDNDSDTLLGYASASNPESGTPTWVRLGCLAPVPTINVDTFIYFDQFKLDYGLDSFPILV